MEQPFKQMRFLLFCTLCLAAQGKAEEFLVRDGCSIQNIVIPNHSFEKGIAGTGGEKPVPGEWYVQNRGQQVTDIASAHSGGGCAKISGTEATSASSFIWTLVTVRPKTYYRIRSWIKTASVKTGAHVFIYEVDSANKVLANAKTDSVTGTQEWNESECCIQTAEGAVAIGIRLVLDGEGTAYFDDVAVQEIKTIPGQLPNTSFEIAQNPRNPLFWWFSTDPSSGSTGTYVRDKNVSHTGTSCLRLENIKENVCASWVPPWGMAVRPDTAYEVSGWIKTTPFAETKGNRGAWLWIFGYEKGKKEPQGALGSDMAMITNAPGWQEVKLKILTGEKMESLTVWPRVDGIGAAWFDDISLKEIPEDEL